MGSVGGKLSICGPNSIE